MIIGIFGPHAVGKTTFLRYYMNALADKSKLSLRVVLADLRQEFILTPDKASWLKKRQVNWQGSRAEKAQLMDFCIKDKAVWIVESAWCFRGMQKELAQYNPNQLKFIIPAAQPETLKHFLIERCASQDKLFRADYWDDNRLEYEGALRYTNFINNYMQPMGVASQVVYISKARSEWAEIYQQLETWVSAC